MEQVKKKIAQLKTECDEAKAQLDDARREKKEAEERADAVSEYQLIRGHAFKNHCLQAELEIQSLQRKLKLSEDDLDRAEDQLAEANARIKEYESELEESKRYVACGESLWLPLKFLTFHPE